MPSGGAGRRRCDGAARPRTSRERHVDFWDVAVMNDALLRQIRADLEQDRDDVAATLETLKDKADPLAQMMTASLKDLRHALEKLDAGTYGRCEECQREIPEQRLEALPATRLCAKCEAEGPGGPPH